MARTSKNKKGQATSAESLPVVLPSDQTVIISGTAITGGNVAAGAADSGNPVKIGGKYNATPPTLDDGDRGDLQQDGSGNLKATLATDFMAQKVTTVGDTTYIAIAPAGTLQATAGWQCQKVVTSGTDTTVTWADGDTLYNNVATDLTTLTYS